MNLDKLVMQFHLDAEDFELERCGHEYKVNGNIIKFIGGWEASHEAWLFGKWLDENGYSCTVSANEVGVATLPEVPDWLTVELSNPRIVTLSAMNSSVRTGLSDVHNGIRKLKRKMWSEISDVQGVGRQTLEALEATFETPLHGVGEFKSVSGVGTTTAERLDEYVMYNG